MGHAYRKYCIGGAGVIDRPEIDRYGSVSFRQVISSTHCETGPTWNLLEHEM